MILSACVKKTGSICRSREPSNLSLQSYCSPWLTHSANGSIINSLGLSRLGTITSLNLVNILLNQSIFFNLLFNSTPGLTLVGALVTLNVSGP